MSPSLSEIGANSNMATYGLNNPPHRDDEEKVTDLLAQRQAARGPGGTFDTILVTIALITAGWMGWAYSHTSSETAPVYRNLVLVGAIFTAVGVAVRVMECTSNRRTADADRIEAHRHQQQMAAIEILTASLQGRGDTAALAADEERIRGLEELAAKVAGTVERLEEEFVEAKEQARYVGIAKAEEAHLNARLGVPSLGARRNDSALTRRSGG